ncbi:MAG: hypothetical protein O7D34_02005, partial [Ignavibacteria bacterium]|nr:hypothetical protein [Ignavibacteria bacterium]
AQKDKKPVWSYEMKRPADSFTYLPLLRWKAAEVRALSKLEPLIRSLVFPIMELCPTAFIRDKRTKDKKYREEILPISALLDRLAKLKAAIGGQAVGIDLINIKDGESPYDCRGIWNLIVANQKHVKLKIVPVTGFNGKGVSYQKLIGSLATEFGNGICVRVSLEDINRRSFAQDISRLLSLLGREPTGIDLIIDLKLVDSTAPLYTELSLRIPEVANWRSLTLLGGSFPVDLSHLEANNTYKIPRLEWSKWENEVQRVRDQFVRGPDFW